MKPINVKHQTTKLLSDVDRFFQLRLNIKISVISMDDSKHHVFRNLFVKWNRLQDNYRMVKKTLHENELWSCWESNMATLAFRNFGFANQEVHSQDRVNLFRFQAYLKCKQNIILNPLEVAKINSKHCTSVWLPHFRLKLTPICW